MRAATISFLTTLLVASTIIAAQPPEVGQQAPDFTLSDQYGHSVTLSAAHGHKVVLVFYRGYW